MVLAALLAVVVVVAGAASSGTFTLGAGSRVLYRERADGVHPDLQWLLDEWEREGTFVVQIAGGPDWPYPGGVRTDEATQQAAAAAGLSAATSLAQTPHGRAAALDVWPDGFNPHLTFDAQPGQLQLMQTFGAWAESKGFTWGGRFSTPDYPHVEIVNWRNLPFPPPTYSRFA